MIGVLIGIELARRVAGVVFVIIGVLLLLYGVYGAYISDLFAHAGDTFPEVCTSIFYKSDGVFGIMANVLATYFILFVLFGAFLEASGAQRFFVDFPLAAVGHKIGGPEFEQRVRKSFIKPLHNAVTFGYDALHVLAQAIEKAKSLDPAKIKDALKITDIKALEGHIRFKDFNGYRNQNKFTPSMIHWKNGQRKHLDIFLDWEE
jgi:hypothetical protein